jgi:hypothetical protein
MEVLLNEVQVETKGILLDLWIHHINMEEKGIAECRLWV